MPQPVPGVLHRAGEVGGPERAAVAEYGLVEVSDRPLEDRLRGLIEGQDGQLEGRGLCGQGLRQHRELLRKDGGHGDAGVEQHGQADVGIGLVRGEGGAIFGDGGVQERQQPVALGAQRIGPVQGSLE